MGCDCCDIVTGPGGFDLGWLGILSRTAMMHAQPVFEALCWPVDAGREAEASQEE